MPLVKPEFIEYNGKKILYLNFVNMAKLDIPVFLEEAKKLVLPNPPGSVLFLANVYKMSFDKATVKNFVAFFKSNRPFVKRTAVFGLDSIKKMLYEASLVLSGRKSENTRVFDGLNAETRAKDWLIM
jgi:hypothetical protein